MAKDKQLPDQPQTMEDYLLSQLEEQVVLKDGSTLKGQDGHVMTMTGLSVDFPLRAVELNLPDNFPIKREQTKRWSSESRTMLASVMPSRDRVR